MTIKQIEAINSADKIIVKTDKTPTYTYFKINNIETDTLDFLYEEASDFTDLDNQIVDFLQNQNEDVIVYCVNGSGYSDSSVRLLMDKQEVEIIAGVGNEANMLSAYPALGFCSFTASQFVIRKFNTFDTNIPLVITEIYDAFIAQSVKIKLLDLFSAECDVIFTHENKTHKCKLYDIDRLGKYNYSSSLLVIPCEFFKKERYTFGDFEEIVKRLRDPDGCPWDRAQTLKTIRENIIEEAYELVEAIDLDDTDKILEECGDVLLQGVFSAVIGEDMGEFNLNDVTTELTKKMINRHTHIFGDNKANDASEALVFWDEAKRQEKSQKSVSDSIKAVSKTFNSLLKAVKIQKIIKKTGFDFEKIEEAYEKVFEEVNELKQAKTANEIENECGDLLFSVVNLLRMLDVSPEIALNRTTNKFIQRFDYVLKKAKENNKEITDCNMQEMEAWYQEGKTYEDR